MGEMVGNKFLMPTRLNIYNFILKSPGLHLRELSRQLDMPLTTVKYHLQVLQKHEYIVEKKEGRYHRYYASQEMGTQEKKFINILREDIPRTIILYLLIHHWSSQIDISASLQKHPTTIEHHLRKLMSLGIIQQVKPINKEVSQETIPKTIECETVGREKVFMLTNPQQIYTLIVTYKDSIIVDPISKDLFEFYTYLKTAGLPEKFIAPKKWEKAWNDLIWEIFPNPYHP